MKKLHSENSSLVPANGPVSRFGFRRRQIFGWPVYVGWWSATVAVLIGVAIAWLL